TIHCFSANTTSSSSSATPDLTAQFAALNDNFAHLLTVIQQPSSPSNIISSARSVRRCTHCDKVGHTADVCFRLHPELFTQYHATCGGRNRFNSSNHHQLSTILISIWKSTFCSFSTVKH